MDMACCNIALEISSSVCIPLQGEGGNNGRWVTVSGHQGEIDRRGRCGRSVERALIIGGGWASQKASQEVQRKEAEGAAGEFSNIDLLPRFL
jgi:hypothetical protein